MKDAGPLMLPGDFGKHLSRRSWLKESVAAVLRKGMARLGWMRVGGWGCVGSGCRNEGRANWGAFLTDGCIIGAIGKEFRGGKLRPLLQETSQESGTAELWGHSTSG